ncbi:hypothetical protein D3C87_1300670 [compost metagenome]
MAAILVDFEPRPFKKFHEMYKLEGAKEIKSDNDNSKWKKRYSSIKKNFREVMALF